METTTANNYKTIDLNCCVVICQILKTRLIKAETLSSYVNITDPRIIYHECLLTSTGHKS